jgi:hypothetical protein
MDEAAGQSHAVALGAYATVAGVVQPAPLPHFSKTRRALPGSPQYVDIEALLATPPTDSRSPGIVMRNKS